MLLKRKIYSELLKWKEHSADGFALLIEGARRIGKSTIVEEFAKNEYKKQPFTANIKIIVSYKKIIHYLCFLVK